MSNFFFAHTFDVDAFPQSEQPCPAFHSTPDAKRKGKELLATLLKFSHNKDSLLVLFFAEYNQNLLRN
ncbi:MAG: hypothetical protein NVS2B14_16270 [Chamaesiphon sp.]